MEIKKFKISLKNLSKYFIYLLLFLFLYTPPIKLVPFSPSYLVIGISIVFVILKYRSFLNFFSDRNLIVILIFMLVITIYTFIIDLFSDYNDKIPLSQTYSLKWITLLLNFTVVNFFFISMFTKKLELKVSGVMEMFLILAVIQSFFVVLMIVFPSFRLFAFKSVMHFTDEKIFQPELWLIRSYGFSSQFLYPMPIFQGIAIMIAILYAYSGNYKYIYVIPFLLISILFNARVGLVVIPLFLLSIILLSLSTMKFKVFCKTFKIAILILVIVAILFIISFYIVDPSLYEFTLNWILGAFETRGSRTFQVLSTHVFFPENLKYWIFGEGRYLFKNNLDMYNSDIGYINYIYFGGLIFSILVYFSFFLLFILGFAKNKNFYMKLYLLAYILIFLFAQYKGIAFDSNAFTNAFLLTAVYIYKFKDETFSYK